MKSISYYKEENQKKRQKSQLKSKEKDEIDSLRIQ